MTETDLSSWLPIADAALVIGCSTRTVERLARAKKLEQRLRPQAGSPAVAVYNPDDVAEEARRRRTTPAPFVLPTVPTNNGNGTGSTGGIRALRNPEPSLSDDPIRQLFAAALRAVLSPPSPPVSETRGGETLFLTIQEAAAVSGLSRAYLTRAIAAKTLPAVRDRGWKIRRGDLEQL